MKPARWDAALIPCTKTKNPLATTAGSLYKSAGFTLMVKHAQQRTGRIVIMSALHGLIRPEDRITVYDAYLPTLSREERAALLRKLRHQADALRGLKILSYLPKAYHEALLEAAPGLAGSLSRPYKNLGLMALFGVLGREIKNYGKEPSRR